MSVFMCPPNNEGRFPLNHIQQHAPADSDPQVLTSWALAYAFRHGWATIGRQYTAYPDGFVGCHIPTTWPDAVAMYEAAQAEREWWIGLAPAAQHTSGSARIQWIVSPNGAVTVSIHRPNGAVCGLRSDGVVWRAKPNSPTGQPAARHVCALGWVLNDLGHPEAAHYRALADYLLRRERQAAGIDSPPGEYDPRWDGARNKAVSYTPYTEEIAPFVVESLPPSPCKHPDWPFGMEDMVEEDAHVTT